MLIVESADGHVTEVTDVSRSGLGVMAPSPLSPYLSEVLTVWSVTSFNKISADLLILHSISQHNIESDC